MQLVCHSRRAVLASRVRGAIQRATSLSGTTWRQVVSSAFLLLAPVGLFYPPLIVLGPLFFIVGLALDEPE